MVLRWSSMTARRTGSTGCGGGRLEQQEEHSRSNTNKPSIEGGMLIYSRNHVADNGGDPADLVLAGQENNGTTATSAISKVSSSHSSARTTTNFEGSSHSISFVVKT